MSSTVETYYAYAILYFVVYGVIGSLWNMTFLRWCGKRADKCSYETQLDYGMKLQSSWLIKQASNMNYRPLWEVGCLMLWPVYLPAAIVTGVYYAVRYLKPEEESEEEVEAF